MPITATNTAARGRAYIDIRVGNQHTIHQVKLDVSALTGVDDADGVLPPGLPILATGVSVTGDTDVVEGVIGPEPVKIGTNDIFGNVIIDGPLNKNAIEDNLGRALDSHELAAMALVKARLYLL